MSASADATTAAAAMTRTVADMVAEAVGRALAIRPAPDGDPWSLARHALHALGDTGALSACLDTAGRLRTAGLRTLITELATTVPAGVTLSTCVQTALFLPLLQELATGEQIGVYQRVLRGDEVGTVAVSDADLAGSDVVGIATSLTRDGAEWRLRGAKDWVTSACFADYFAVLARTGPARHFFSLTMVLVPADARGVLVTPVDSAAMRHAGLGRLELADVRLPADAVLGRPGRGLAYFLRHVATERLADGFWASALGSELLARTSDRLRHRSVGGAPLWHNPAVRQRLGGAAVQLRLIQALASEITERHPVIPVPAADTAALKAAVAVGLADLVGTCVQLHGADALRAGDDMAQLLVDVRAFGLGGGSTETMLELVANSDLVTATNSRSGP